MILYAIRHKPTGNFLAQLPNSRRAGHTWEEPQPAEVRLPRLFTKEQWAKYALRAWLAGKWKQEAVCSSWESFQPDDVDMVITPCVDRKAEDMEIVIMALTIVGTK